MGEAGRGLASTTFIVVGVVADTAADAAVDVTIVVVVSVATGGANADGGGMGAVNTSSTWAGSTVVCIVVVSKGSQETREKDERNLLAMHNDDFLPFTQSQDQLFVISPWCLMPIYS